MFIYTFIRWKFLILIYDIEHQQFIFAFSRPTYQFIYFFICHDIVKFIKFIHNFYYLKCSKLITACPSGMKNKLVNELLINWQINKWIIVNDSNDT